MNGCGYSFGIEEEFFIVCAADGALIERMPSELLSAARTCNCGYTTMPGQPEHIPRKPCM